MTEFHAHWTNRTDRLLHDVAEALGVSTDQVMAALPREGFVTALFNPDEFNMNGEIWSAFLRVRADGTLGEVERRSTGRTFADMTAEIEGRLKGKLGDDT